MMELILVCRRPRQSDRERIHSLRAEVAVLRLFLAAAVTGLLPFASKRPKAWTSDSMLAAAVGLAGPNEDPARYAAAFVRVSSAIHSEVAKHESPQGAAAAAGEG